ncbi:MAG: class I SAM-dependent methyltransferase [Magnetococcales bacterium]|nr:class I SAM-dependent methyltransferase [Magnetococcales bacterium]
MEKGLTARPSVALQLRISDSLVVPQYLEQTYWWAYLHPNGVRFFERQWLVNLILWGNFARLRDAALTEMGTTIEGRTLQVACVYGDFTPRMADRLTPGAQLDVVDVAPVQLENLKRKLKNGMNVHLHHQDSTALAFQDGEFDNVVLFFLLHEQPDEVREKTVREAMRVVKPGGRVIFVDYHRPSVFNPFRYIMIPILFLLEPFALDLWGQEIVSWAEKYCADNRSVGGQAALKSIRKDTFFGGLYQKVVLERAPSNTSAHATGTLSTSDRQAQNVPTA